MRFHVPAGVVAVVALTATAGVVAAFRSDPPPPVVDAPPGVTAEVLQYRADVTRGRFAIKVRNDGDAPITVAGARFVSPRFSGEAGWFGGEAGETYTITPGTATDLPAPVPAAVCSGRPAAADDEREQVELDLVDLPPEGTTGTATLPVGDPFELLGRLRGDDCRLAEVERVAELEVLAPLRVVGAGTASRAFLDLRITPAGGEGTVTLVAAQTTTLLAPPGGGTGWPLDRTVTGAGPPEVLPVEIRPARCDPHAVAEDKLGTVLRIEVRQDTPGPTVGGDGVVQVVSPVAVRNQVYDWVGQVCGNAVPR